MQRHAFRDPGIETSFRRDGFVILDLLGAGDVDRLEATYASCAARHENGFTPTVLLDDLELRARIHRAVARVFEARILPVLDGYRIVVGSFAVKQADCDFSGVGLHQDLTFVDETENGQAGISVWCPLVEVGEENGCLRVAIGSHVLNSRLREPCSLPYPDLIDLIENELMTYLPMRPGQALLMDNRLFHGSPANRGNHPRVVAAGVAVPRESRLLYCHRDLQGDPSLLEVWEVPDDFYLRHGIGRRPREGRRIATVVRQVEELSEEDLRRRIVA